MVTVVIPTKDKSAVWTLKASNNDLPWPDRATCTVPSVVAELILVSGTSISDADLLSLKDKVFDAIQTTSAQVDRKYGMCSNSISTTQHNYYILHLYT